MEDEVQQDIVDRDDVLQLVCFKLAEEEYSVDITRVQEVIRVQKITPVPQMPDFVLGVVNIRGNVVPVFDLRKKIGLELKPFDGKTKILVITINNILISLIVDEILDNIKIDKKLIDPAPNVKMTIEKDCVKGVGLIENRMIIILDLDWINDEINKEIEHFRKQDNVE